jgi:hypothetical protein
VTHQVLPDRYEVTRRGTPDPDASQYFVVDVVHDWSARVALQRLVALYLMQGLTIHAQELQQFLDSTKDAAVRVIAAQQPEQPSKRRAR